MPGEEHCPSNDREEEDGAFGDEAEWSAKGEEAEDVQIGTVVRNVHNALAVGGQLIGPVHVDAEERHAGKRGPDMVNRVHECSQGAIEQKHGNEREEHACKERDRSSEGEQVKGQGAGSLYCSGQQGCALCSLLHGRSGRLGRSGG